MVTQITFVVWTWFFLRRRKMVEMLGIFLNRFDCSCILRICQKWRTKLKSDDIIKIVIISLLKLMFKCKKTLHKMSVFLFFIPSEGSSVLFGNSLVEVIYSTMIAGYLVLRIVPWQFNLQGYVYKIITTMSRTSLFWYSFLLWSELKIKLGKTHK